MHLYVFNTGEQINDELSTQWQTNKFYFFATFGGNDVNLVVATVFRVAKVAAEPFEIIAGLDNRRDIEVERLIVVVVVVGCSVGFFAVVAMVRPPIPDIVRRVNDNFDAALTGRSVLFERGTFNRDGIAGEPTFLDGTLTMLPRLARRCSVDAGARTVHSMCVCVKNERINNQINLMKLTNFRTIYRKCL